MRILDTVEVKNNLSLVVRERGKIVARRDGHNIWLNVGREYLAQLMSFSGYTGSPPSAVGTPERQDRIQYMGLGIGGTRQVAPVIASTAPLLGAYPGTNLQTDIDPTLTHLERPVRISGGSSPSPGDVGDVWLGQVQAPVLHETAYSSTYRRVFTSMEISYAPFLTVPLSEIGLFTSAAVPTGVDTRDQHMVAYDTFDSLSKTAAFELEISWTVRF